MGTQALNSPKRRFPAWAVARVCVLRAARPAPRRQRKHALVTESHMGSYPIPQTADFDDLCAAGTDLARALDAKRETVCQAARLAPRQKSRRRWMARAVTPSRATR